MKFRWPTYYNLLQLIVFQVELPQFFLLLLNRKDRLEQEGIVSHSKGIEFVEKAGGDKVAIIQNMQ